MALRSPEYFDIPVCLFVRVDSRRMPKAPLWVVSTENLRTKVVIILLELQLLPGASTFASQLARLESI